MTYTLSPSSAYRWSNCPGSVHVCASLPKLPSSTAATEGTLAHAFAAAFIHRAVSEAWPRARCTSAAPECPDLAVSTEAMLNGAQLYADAVVAKISSLTAEPVVAFGVEDEVGYHIKDVDSGKDFALLRGRVDFWARTKDGVQIIVDYKFGGVPVPVKDNPQLLCYAACLSGFGFTSKVVLGIVQPNAEISDFSEYSCSRWHGYGASDVKHAFCEHRRLFDAALAASNADTRTHRKTGDWCGFCPARSVCRARIGDRLLLAAIAAGEAEMAEDASNEQIGVWLDALKEIDTARDDLVRIAKARICGGENVPGWRVQTRRRAVWRGDIAGEGKAVEQAKRISAALGLDGDAVSMLVETSLVSPSKAKKFIPADALSALTSEAVSTALVKD